MNYLFEPSAPNGLSQSPLSTSHTESAPSLLRRAARQFPFAAWFAGLFCLLLGAPLARADQNPTGCTGSALGIVLYTDAPDVHIGDTLHYSVLVFNGTSTGPVVCEASSIQAFVVTPDGISHPITLTDTTLFSGQSEFYSNVVSYVVRQQDILPDQTVAATASDTGVIHQNINNSEGGGNQGVNTQVSLPCVLLTMQCAGGIGEGAPITFTGTITNCGNDTLVNITVTNFDNNGQQTQVAFISTLASGQVAAYSGSWIPLNACNPSTVTLVVQASDQFTTYPKIVTSSITNTCSETLTPGIAVSKLCPTTPVAPGQMLTFSGTVTNTGNVTLTNIVVVDNQPSANTTVFTLASLAPGAGSAFSASYTAPANCAVADTLIATASSDCGVPVSSSASANCPITTTPQLSVTQNCPVNPVIPGGLLTYSGTVANAGNVTLTNVVVLNNLSGSSPLLTIAALPPGAVSNFTGSYVAPANCLSTSTSTATGRSICGVSVTNSASTTCPITSTPILALTQACPLSPPTPGGVLTYSGTVSNAGNITLTNVVILNNRTGATPIFTAATMIPGAASSFTGSYLAPSACSDPSTSTATAESICGVGVTNSVSTSCPIGTAPLITLTQNCSTNLASPGSLLIYSGTVSNAGNVTLDNVTVLNNLSGAGPIFTATTLAPGATGTYIGSYPAPTNCSSTSISTASGVSLCGVAVSNVVTTTCSIDTAPLLSVKQNCPTNSVSPGGLLTYSGSVSNAGNITLTNVVVLNNLSGATPVFTAATIPPGAISNFTGSYVAPTNCSSTSIATAIGESICGISVTNSASSICPISTAPILAVTQLCPVVATIAGDVLTISGTVSNAGNITLTNIVVLNNQVGSTPVFTASTMAPGAVSSFTGSYFAPTNCSATSTSTATAQSTCGIDVTNAASTTCAVITIPSVAITLNCPKSVTPNATLTYAGTVSNPGNITLTNVVILNNETGTTPVFTAATLAPGAVSNYTVTFTGPATGDAVSTSTVRAGSLCGVFVTNSASSSCPITTAPGIAVTKSCPAQPVIPGEILVYKGTVTNTGNVLLTNVVVVDNEPAANTAVITIKSLAVGQGTNFSGSYIPVSTCTSSDTLIVTAADSSNGAKVTNTVSVTCPIITIAGISISQNCSTNLASPGSLLIYSGTVSNVGNVTLDNVMVVNNLSGAGPIFTAATLAPGATGTYIGSYPAPTNCSSTSISTASGVSACGVAVSNVVITTCSIDTAPLLSVKQNCPTNPVSPGGLLTYSGTVSNAGNIILTNVVVLNNQTGTTPILTVATLPPGASSNFTGSYLAPTNCSSTSTSTATGQNICGGTVTNAASTTCLITTTPLLVMTQVCPANAATPGGLLTYSGTVSNAGNITLTNVVILNNRTGSTPIFTAATMAPGAVSSFTGSYLAPAACSDASTSTATAESICGVSVTTSASTTCPITTSPFITVTQNCPTNLVSPGSLLVYSGTVSNAGNITLDNVVVLNNETGATPVFTAASLAPGATGHFTGSYLAPTNCSSLSTSTATGTSVCGVGVTNTASTTCLVGTTPLLTVTETCPVNPSIPGGPVTYTGTVSNAGNVTLTNVVVLNNQTGSTVIFTAATLAIGGVASFTGSYTAPDNCSSTSILTAIGRSTCGFAATNTASATCPIITTPAIVVSQVCPVIPVAPGGILTYSGTVSNAGNITLTDVVVVNNYPSSNTVILTVAALAPGATTNFTGSYQVPLNCCVVWSTVEASGQGCAGVVVTDEDTTTCTVLTSPNLVVTKTCPPGILQWGELMTYSGTVSNAGNITIVGVTVMNNESSGSILAGPITLVPGEVTTYTASYIIPQDFCGADTVTASGLDICAYLPVSGSVTTVCPVAIPAPHIAVTMNCPTQPTPRGGLFTFSGSVSNAGTITLVNVQVVDSQPTNNTLVFGPITLAPGASVNFSNSYIAPNCCCFLLDVLTASGQDHCLGSNTTATAAAECPLLSIPSIEVVQNCPLNPIPMGSLYQFSGYVTNTGNTVLTNVFVYGPEGTNAPLVASIDLAPGQSQNYAGSYVVPFNTCSVSVTAMGQEICGSASATNTASCPVATITSLALTQECPVIEVSPGNLLTISGTVSNAGNITLNNVVVLNNAAGATPVFTSSSLAPGAAANFTGSYLAPTNCSSTSTSTATGQSICGLDVTNSASTTCILITTPVLAVTQNCPTTPVTPNSLLTYSGSVSNAGDIMLTNVVIVNSQSGANPILTVATLSPGAIASFTGSYVAPDACSSTSTSTAIGQSICGLAATNSASATCQIITAPNIAVTQSCLTNSGSGLLTFSGTVRNTGNIILTNVVVLNSQTGATPIFTVATLSPGAVANFTGSYVPPATCSSASTSTAIGQSICGPAVTNSASTTCQITFTPSLAITEECPPGPLTPGTTVYFNGTVSNAGNITITNVYVYSGQPTTNTVLLGPVSLAPGASEYFVGLYVAQGGSDMTTNQTIITNLGSTITTNPVNVISSNLVITISTNPASSITTNIIITYTTNLVTPTFGDIDPVADTMTDRFDVPAHLHGLMYADQDENWGPTQFYAVREPVGSAAEFDTISTIAPNAGTVTDRMVLSSSNYDALTLAAPDVGYGSINFYYTRHNGNGPSTFGEIIAQGASSSADLWPLANSGYKGLAFAAANVDGYGANLFYYVRQSVAGPSVFGTINPTPGGVETDEYDVGTNFDSLVYVPGAVSSWGASLFAYLRHDSIGSIIGTINPTTQVATDRINLGTNFLSDLTFTATDVGYGPNLFYYIRPAGTNLTTNTSISFTTNTTITYTTNSSISFTTNIGTLLTTNAVTNYTTNILVTFTPTNTVMTVGQDICMAQTVSAAANCLGPIASPLVVQPLTVPAFIALTMLPNNVFSFSFSSQNGATYALQYNNSLDNATWTDLETVVGTGGPMTVTDAVVNKGSTRFYRIIVSP